MTMKAKILKATDIERLENTANVAIALLPTEQFCCVNITGTCCETCSGGCSQCSVCSGSCSDCSGGCSVCSINSDIAILKIVDG